MLPSEETILWLDILQETAIKHTKAKTIWLPYYRQQFQMHFATYNVLNKVSFKHVYQSLHDNTSILFLIMAWQ